jgi:hypothetical protein
MERYVMHLVHSDADEHWHLEQEGGDVIAAYETKAEAVVAGKQKGNAIEQKGDDAQLVIHREDGSVEVEYTYGHDPRRIPG